MPCIHASHDPIIPWRLRYTSRDQSLCSRYLHHSIGTDTQGRIIECCGSPDDVFHIRVVAAVHGILVKDQPSLLAWRASALTSSPLSDDSVPRCLFFARLWLHSTAALFGDDVLSLRDVDQHSPLLSILGTPSASVARSSWPLPSDEAALCRHLVGQLPALVAEVGPQDQEDQTNVEQSHNL